LITTTKLIYEKLLVTISPKMELGFPKVKPDILEEKKIRKKRLTLD
jgi:hypothetical protein